MTDLHLHRGGRTPHDEPRRDPRFSALLRDLMGPIPMRDVSWDALAGRVGAAIRARQTPWWGYVERWQRRAIPLAVAAGAGHALLYALLIALPLSGWYAASQMGVGVQFLGVHLPALTAPLQGRPGIVAEFHESAGSLILLLAGLMVLGVTLRVWAAGRRPAPSAPPVERGCDGCVCGLQGGCTAAGQASSSAAG